MLKLLLFCFMTPTIGAVDFEHSGNLSFETHQYLEEISPTTRTYDTIFKLEPEFSLKGAKDTLKFSPSLRSNPASQQSREQFFFNPKEAYWQFKDYPLRTRLGFNTYAWGIIDGFSPLDLMQTRSYIDPINSEKLGAPTVDVKYESFSWSLHALYFIHQDLSVLPAIDNRWLPRRLLVNSAVGGFNFRLPSNFNYAYQDDLVLDKAQKHNFAVKFEKRFSALDVSLVHFEGISPLPQFQIFATGTPSVTEPNTVNVDDLVQLRPIHYRQRISGGNIAWSLSGLVLRIESAYTHVITRSPLLPLWNFQSALSLEKQFSIGSKSLALLATGYKGDSSLESNNLLSSGTRLFDESGALGFRLSFSTSTSFLGGVLYDFKNDSYFMNASFSTKILDSLNLVLRYDGIVGQEDTLIGSYNRNSRAILQLAAHW